EQRLALAREPRAVEGGRDGDAFVPQRLREARVPGIVEDRPAMEERGRELLLDLGERLVDPIQLVAEPLELTRHPREPLARLFRTREAEPRREPLDHGPL